MSERFARRPDLVDPLVAVALAVFALFGVRQWPPWSPVGCRCSVVTTPGSASLRGVA